MDPKLFLVILGLMLLDGRECTCPAGCFCYSPDESTSTVACLGKFPDAFPITATDISMYNMRLSEIPAMAFQGLPNLKSLAIYNSDIGKISACAFKGLGNMTHLSIYLSNIGSIDGYAFSELKNITHLSIYSAVIGIINSYAFYDISELQSFSIYEINITEVESFAFYKIQQVKSFSLYLSNITTIRSSVMAESSVQDVSIYFSYIQNLECGTVDAIKTSIATGYFSFYQIGLTCDCTTAWLLQPAIKNLLGESSLRQVNCINLAVGSVYDLSPDDIACGNYTGNGTFCAVPEATTAFPECHGKISTTTENPNSNSKCVRQDKFYVVFFAFCSLLINEFLSKFFYRHVSHEI